jgi:SH3-like domain-containing protein
MHNKLFTILLFVFFANVALSAPAKIQEVHYFASLRANETNVRSGPGHDYPIKFTFQDRDIPVLVVSEYDNWLEIEDYQQQKGWVSQSLVTKKQHLMVVNANSPIAMYKKDNINSRIIFFLQNFVIGEYKKCNQDMCLITINNKNGWVAKTNLYGWQ